VSLNCKSANALPQESFCAQVMFYMVLKTNVSILQVSLYMDKFAGVCQSVLHDCKLTFLQIICDHDLFVEMPGRDPSDR
jgi:hypothetical protein